MPRIQDTLSKHLGQAKNFGRGRICTTKYLAEEDMLTIFHQGFLGDLFSSLRCYWPRYFDWVYHFSGKYQDYA